MCNNEKKCQIKCMYETCVCVYILLTRFVERENENPG